VPPERFKMLKAQEKKTRLSFNELLAKYKREGATKDRSNQPNGAKGIKAPLRHKGIHHQ
jgi:hypothetical protein